MGKYIILSNYSVPEDTGWLPSDKIYLLYILSMWLYKNLSYYLCQTVPFLNIYDLCKVSFKNMCFLAIDVILTHVFGSVEGFTFLCYYLFPLHHLENYYKFYNLCTVYMSMKWLLQTVNNIFLNSRDYFVVVLFLLYGMLFLQMFAYAHCCAQSVMEQ